MSDNGIKWLDLPERWQKYWQPVGCDNESNKWSGLPLF